MKGKFITLEGIDGAGKSSHLHYIKDFLTSQGKTVHITHEPGGTPLGEKLRTLILNDLMSVEAETLLLFAARLEHSRQVIFPRLLEGEWVICDRFTDSTFAYQGGGKDLPEKKLQILEDWISISLQPDLTLLFDIPPEIAKQRLYSIKQKGDRFENESLSFFEKVRHQYLKQYHENPHRIHLIDSTLSIEKISKQLEILLLS